MVALSAKLSVVNFDHRGSIVPSIPGRSPHCLGLLFVLVQRSSER
jgi:hypothetical protein